MEMMEKAAEVIVILIPGMMILSFEAPSASKRACPSVRWSVRPSMLSSKSLK